MVAGRDLGAVNGAGRGGAVHGPADADAPLMPNGSCFCPAVCHLAKTFGQHLRSGSRQKKKKECALLQSAARIQINGAQWECGGLVGMGVRHVQHACTTDTRAHVPHLFDGNLHALDSHQRQTVSASVPLRPTHTIPNQPSPLLHLLSLCLSFF